MRLRACLIPVLLASGACTQIPKHTVIDVDGNVIEIKQTPAAIESANEPLR